MHTQYSKYTQDNYNNTRPTNNNYTQDNLKLATIHPKSNNTHEKQIRTSNDTGIWRGVFQLTRVLVLSDVIFILLSSVVILTPHDNFLVVPVLHSVSDKMSVYSETYTTPNMWAKVGVLYVKYGGT